MRRHVDAHFAGTIGPEDERAMRAHIGDCEPCRARYRRQLVLVQLDPQAPKVEWRLARGLGLRATPETPLGQRWAWMATGIVALAAAALLYVRASHRDDFAARGGVPTGVPSGNGLHVYRVAEGGPSPAVDAVLRDGELAFAYENDGHKRYLMIFGVDDLGKVYWFYPAWIRAEEDPKAIEALATPGVHELPDAVHQRIEGSRFDVHLLFLDAPRGVHEVERAVASGTIQAMGIDRIERFGVVP